MDTVSTSTYWQYFVPYRWLLEKWKRFILGGFTAPLLPLLDSSTRPPGISSQWYLTYSYVTVKYAACTDHTDYRVCRYMPLTNGPAEVIMTSFPTATSSSRLAPQLALSPCCKHCKCNLISCSGIFFFSPSRFSRRNRCVISHCGWSTKGTGFEISCSAEVQYGALVYISPDNKRPAARINIRYRG